MNLQGLLQETFRLLFLINVPILIGVVCAGTLIALFMAVTGVKDKSLSYAVRLITVVIIIYVMSEKIIQWLVDLMTSCLK